MSSETISGPILTSDGIPLKVSLRKAEKRNKIRAFLLVLPLLAFILITFIILRKIFKVRWEHIFKEEPLKFIKTKHGVKSKDDF